MALKFYRCPVCGNVVFMAVDSGVTPKCCGKEMIELEANDADASGEKHLPVVEFLGDHEMKVTVGSQPHPMLHEHHISFVCLETDHGAVFRYLWHDDHVHKDVAETCICFKGEPKAVYEYCNIHGLWKTDVSPMKCKKGGTSC